MLTTLTLKVNVKLPLTWVNLRDKRPFRIVHKFAPQNPEIWFAHTKTNRTPSSPPNLTDLWLTNIKIRQHTPTSPLATAHSVLRTWSSTIIPIPNSSKHTTLSPCTQIIVLLQLEWMLLIRGQWKDSYAQRVVAMSCLICVEVAMWFRAKMWKWGGQRKRSVSLVRRASEMTSRVSC